MLYSEYIHKAKELVIAYDEDAKVTYLEPEWQTILYSNGLGNLEDVKDMLIEGWYDLEDVLKLEVEKRNATSSKKNLVYEWIYSLITSTIDPAMIQEENDLVQGMLELAKARNSEPQTNESSE